MFKNKIVLITGGTGSFGKAFLYKLINEKPSEIRILSRDEKKQEDLRREINSNIVKFYLGDVRDKYSINDAIKNSHYIFHAAALKQVPSCEFFPMEAIKTNVIGTENVLNNAIENNVEKVICLSTDKAVYPVNAMGMSKALMEKIAISKAIKQDKTKISITRYGNVLASRGSVVPLFMSQISKSQPLTITDLKMTRFVMTLEDAINLVIYAFKDNINGCVYVKKTSACTIETLANAVKKICLVPKKYPHKIIGIRHGEKNYETLIRTEEISYLEENSEFYKILPDLKRLDYSINDYGKLVTNKKVKEFTSHTAKKIDENELYSLLIKSKNLVL